MGSELFLYNTLTRQKEIFKPLKKGKVGMYSCGPTVYWYQHIGNFRTAILADLLKRVFLYNGYEVKHIVNFTDVDDKTIKGSQKEGVSLRELTRKYERIYLKDLDSLGIMKPTFMRATENIEEMIKLIESLLKKDFAYKANDGIYFSISKFKEYGRLAGLDKIKKTKERISSDEYDKDNANDFALWKFRSDEDGGVYWDAKFGDGRPGWHIECSAMSMKELGKNFDVHTGGMDLIFPHHTNEIAQSECSSGKKFVNYWVHGGMLNLKEGKMSKSLGNIYTLKELEERGYSPEVYRYLCLQTHYRKPLEFSFEAMDGAKNAYERLKRKVIELRGEKHKGNDFSEKYNGEFLSAVNDDLNMPKALSVLWSAVDDFDFDPKSKLKLIEKMDSVFGLGVKKMKEERVNLSGEAKRLLEEREKARKSKDWPKADELRKRIEAMGFVIEDTAEGARVREKG